MKKGFSVLLLALMLIPLSSFTPINDIKVADREGNWFNCGGCGTIFYGGRQSQGICPAGGEHYRTSVNGLLLNMTDCSDCAADNCNSAFYFCKKCSGLFFALTKDQSAPCPGGGKHEAENWDFRYYVCSARPGNKPVFKDDKINSNQENYYSAPLCKKCHLIMAGLSFPCAGGGTHEESTAWQRFYLIAKGGPGSPE